MRYWTLLKQVWPNIRRWLLQRLLESAAVPPAATLEPAAPPVVDMPTMAMPALAAIEPEPLSSAGEGTVNTVQMIMGAANQTVHGRLERAAETAYTNGQYRVMHGALFFCLTAGTTGAGEPTLSIGDVTDGTVVWRHCLSHRRGGLILCNIDKDDDLTYNFFPLSVGPRLSPVNGSIILTGDDCPQSAVYALTSGVGPASYGELEW